VEATQRAFSTTGTIDASGRLQVDTVIPITGPSRVQVIILFPEEAEIGEAAWLGAGATNPAFDFLEDPAEEIYTPADGIPFHDSR
jgi:hypothetical protein